jgi:hypothetical protein
MSGRRRLAAAALAAITALAGCGPDAGGPIAQVGRALAASLGQSRADAPPLRQQLTRAAIREYGQPVILVEAPAIPAEATLRPLAQNGPNRTWITADGVTLTFRNGVVVATRGLGEDLMSADTAAAEAALGNRRAGPAVRTHWRLDGDHRQVRIRYDCEFVAEGSETIEIIEERHATVRFREICRSGESWIENRYWIGARDGVVWRSRQWVSPKVGYLAIDVLIP